MFLSKGLPVLQMRLSHLLLTACLGGLLFQSTRWYRQRKTSLISDWEDPYYVGDLSPEEEYLERLIDIHGLTNLTQWQAWRITSSELSSDVEPMTDVHTNFQPHPDLLKVIDVHNPNASELRVVKRMEMPIHSRPTQITLPGSVFLFGVSTSYERIAAKDWAIFRAWKRWLTDGNGASNGAGLVLMLDHASSEQLDAMDAMLHEAGIDAYVTSTSEPTSKARRYYEMVRILKTYGATLAASGQPKHWFGIVEDTIFFPSLAYLRERLSSYNPNNRLYIGIPSERSDWQQDGKSITTYGGGAVIMSRHVVALIPKLSCLEMDIPAISYRSQKWDILLKNCVKKGADIDMHVIPAFYSPHDANYKPQLESHETGMRPLLLHDYQERHRIDVGMAHLVTDICGEACFMHQYLFHDNWAIINGVSISHHPDGLIHRRHHNHHKQHHAHNKRPGHGNSVHENENSDEQDTFGNTAKTPVSGQIVINEDKIQRRPLDWTGRKEVWNLVDSATVASGSVWQAYLKRGVRAAGPPQPESSTPAAEELDSLIVLIWEKKKSG
ncbi:hypothetical protein E4U35_001579 [Claviceps purpurea]|nr:hypothetical protein E4U38_007911 [Claviceps purpurea]KAG6167393.1 hypothetical protein E4U11_007101 [Claviceps purpurea]KAG6172449.1 hypothetical protein E4U51_007330 [Claviceps purpurea]KAG6188270.1 hypothetical protein E4U36_006999 [Claviceps purpurea]KAG6189179.1 hypothetical protein E4U27_006727 [Claviceps purpurea]